MTPLADRPLKRFEVVNGPERPPAMRTAQQIAFGIARFFSVRPPLILLNADPGGGASFSHTNGALRDPGLDAWIAGARHAQLQSHGRPTEVAPIGTNANGLHWSRMAVCAVPATWAVSAMPRW